MDHLSTVVAQDTAVATLRRALATNRVHHAYLFDGPAGVGKERAALGLAQALVCETREIAGDRACGACSACVRALPKPGQVKPMHPDVVMVGRALYEPGQIGRRNQETQDISIDQVRVLVLARAAFGPHEGRAKVFIVRAAEELSISAANALLKTLEEPGPRTHFILLSEQPDVLLPTVRSRTQRVRFGHLPDAVVAKLLVAQGTDEADAQKIASLAGGSMAHAHSLADEEESLARTEFVGAALRAIDADTASAALELAADAKKSVADIPANLLALATELASRGRENARAGKKEADRDAARHRIALEAIRQLDANGAAQLVMEAAMLKMRAS